MPFSPESTSPQRGVECDVLVIGAGASGLSTAVTARKLGLDVLVVEKEPFFGGTMAFSGGVLWIPGNPQAKARGIADTKEAARTYLRHEAGNRFDAEKAEVFLENGPRMIEFFGKDTEVRFIATDYPDYHPDVEGGVAVGRSVVAAPYDARRLGKELARLRPPLRTITFLGMMFNSSNADLKHFFNVTRSPVSAAYVAKRLASHFKDLATHRRGVQLTAGNALAARLAKSALDLGIPIWTDSPARELLREGGRVTGAVVQGKDGPVHVLARRGVVLAAGGYPRNPERTGEQFRHVKRGGEHVSPAPPGNTGDGARLAGTVGAGMVTDYPEAAAWIPVSKVPLGGRKTGVFPHLVDRYKPGIIAVNRHGQRFCNESNSYHDVGAAMQRTCEGERETAAWLIADHATIRKYGLGFAKPAPMPLSLYTRSGYLLKGATLADLARKAGIDAAGLEETVRRYNATAERGEDPEFHRGSTAFNRFLGDPAHKPNPNVAPVKRGPFYAVKLYVGDLGTFNGIRTDAACRVLGEDGQAVPGLYALGNDAASIMGGNYPGAGITLGPHLTFGYVLGHHLAGQEMAPAQDARTGRETAGAPH
ncbi:FAD-dependent oxidoreductase [Roseomonas gilardii subsp. gilardii]|uniref:FAD-dependent oxidoreductase n=1 Tax=Roseomonas gilardii TaxID=257708 RepID=UPI001FFA9FCD|nr:FAD-dependent oxidoreductase [Roseomonas gilardii]UPG72974.1 FAD-dependent oxidoreductase [Roseomonas gilardii subsp. gilardii]